MRNTRERIETLGYPSQRAAIVALYQQQFPPKTIAALAKAPINSVHRTLSDYRQAGGRLVACVPAPPADPMPLANPIWDLDESDRRIAFYRRAREAARAALKDASL